MILSAIFWTFVISMFFDIEEKHLFCVFLGILMFLAVTSDDPKVDSQDDNKSKIEITVDVKKENVNKEQNFDVKNDKWAPQSSEAWNRKSD